MDSYKTSFLKHAAGNNEEMIPMVLDIALRAIDRLIDLAKINEKRLRVRFEEIYKPSFKELQGVHSDYLAILTELDCKLARLGSEFPSSDPAAVEVLEFLRMRRTELLPVRTKLAAFGLFVESKKGLELPQVERAFLQSVAKYFEANGELNTDPSMSISYALVDQLERAICRRVKIGQGSAAPSKFNQGRVSQIRQEIQDSISSLDEQWKISVHCFNELRIQYTIHCS